MWTGCITHCNDVIQPHYWQKSKKKYVELKGQGFSFIKGDCITPFHRGANQSQLALGIDFD